MSSSVTKHAEQKEAELEYFRANFAYQKVVKAADSSQTYDFSDVQPGDIKFSLHSDERIKTVARNLNTGIRECVYLKYGGKEAKIIKDKDGYYELPKGMLWPHIVDQSISEKVRKGYEGKSFQEVAVKMATGKFPVATDAIKGNQGESPEEFKQRLKDHLNKVKENLPERLEQMNFETFVTDYCNGLRDLLIEKNKSYGNSALDPVRVFSKSDTEEQIRVRIDDKLSRIKRGNNNFNEDTIQDLQGYLILLQYKKAQE